MNKNKIFTIISTVVVIVLVFLLNNTVSSEVQLKKKIKSVEKQVVTKLKWIRRAEKLYYSSHNKYTDDWEKLKQFVKEGRIYNISIKETAIPLGYGRDSVIREIDTLGYAIVYDSIFSKIQGFDLDKLEKLPQNPSKSFGVKTDSLKTKNGEIIGLIQVSDTAPLNPKRRETNKSFAYKPLQFGSLTRVTTEGNWE